MAGFLITPVLKNLLKEDKKKHVNEVNFSPVSFSFTDQNKKKQ